MGGNVKIARRKYGIKRRLSNMVKIKYVVYSDTCPRCGGYVPLGDSYHIPFRHRTGFCNECGMIYPANWIWKLLYKLRIFGSASRKEWKLEGKKRYHEKFDFNEFKDNVLAYCVLVLLLIVCLPFAILKMIFK